MNRATTATSCVSEMKPSKILAVALMSGDRERYYLVGKRRVGCLHGLSGPFAVFRWKGTLHVATLNRKVADSGVDASEWEVRGL